MRNIVPVIVLIFVLFTSAGKANVNELKDLANEQYRSQNYETALQLYDSIEAFGYESAMLYYNMGNTYYKLKQVPQAILYYERSLKLDPTNVKTIQNLSRAKLLTIDRIEEIPEFFLLSTYRKFINVLSSNAWAVLSIVLVVLSVLFLTIYVLSNKVSARRFGFYMGLVLFLFGAVMFLFSYQQYNVSAMQNTAIIMSPTVTLKGAPNENSSELYIVHEGTKVTIIDSVNNWREVRLSDGKKGWMKAEQYELI